MVDLVDGQNPASGLYGKKKRECLISFECFDPTLIHIQPNAVEILFVEAGQAAVSEGQLPFKKGRFPRYHRHESLSCGSFAIKYLGAQK